MISSISEKWQPITKTGQITVSQPTYPQAATIETQPAENGITITNTTAHPDILPTSVLWEYGDGTQETTAGTVTARTHAYTQPGIYTVRVSEIYVTAITRQASALFRVGGGGSAPEHTTAYPGIVVSGDYAGRAA